MTIQPRDQDDVYESIRDQITSKISKVTNFVQGSFNRAFIGAYSDQIREAEIKALSAELSGIVDYAGKELSEQDLNNLGIEGVEPEEINKYMEPSQLDNLAANQSVFREEGSPANSVVEFTTADSTTEIEEGFVVSTQPTSDGNLLRYAVDADEDGTVDPTSDATVSPTSGENTVTAQVIAQEVGPSHNVGPGSITYIPNPTPGIQGVTNTEPASGGISEQSDASLRSDVKTAIFSSSGGGTTSGIRGYINTNSSTSVRSIGIEEFTDEKPPFVEVVVDGGNEAEVTQLIDEAKPVGIRHDLIRPSSISIGTLTYSVGADVSEGDLSSVIVDHFGGLGISDSFYWSALLQDILNSNEYIKSTPAINTYINEVGPEQVEYSSAQSQYKLEYGPFGSVNDEEHLAGPEMTEFETMFGDINTSSVSVEVVVNDSRVVLSDTEFSVIDASGNGTTDTVSLDSSVEPDDGSLARISYTHNQGSFGDITTVSGKSFTQGTDYELVDTTGSGNVDSIDWSIGGSSPADGDRMVYGYTPYRSFTGDLIIDQREKFDVDGAFTDVRVSE